MTDRRGIETSSPAPTARVQRVLPAPPQVVYDQRLDPDALSEWMCPQPARCRQVEIEPWVGGSVRLDIEEAGAVFSVLGTFRSLDRPRRLSFSWRCTTWPDGSLDSIVVVSLTPHGRQETLMTIEHTLLLPELLEQHQRGWTAVADQLAAAIAASNERYA